MMVVGHGLIGLFRGVLIDDRNRLSMSRLQATLWTILVLSGYLTAALSNMFHAQAEPLAISIPQQLWVLLGISTTALVGSPLILSTKTGETPQTPAMKQEVKQKAADGQIPLPPDSVDTRGKVPVWLWPSDSQMGDLFKGDEVANVAQVDLAKVQVFFFTLVVVVAYGAAVFQLFPHEWSSDKISAFPPLDQSVIALLGISHAGYLANKAVPRS
jgi:hypothetical protein